MDKETKEGLVETYLHPNGKVGVLLDVRCETDFAAKTEEFKELAHELALQIVKMNPETIGEIMGKLVDECSKKLGEDIVVKRFERYQI